MLNMNYQYSIDKQYCLFCIYIIFGIHKLLQENKTIVIQLFGGEGHIGALICYSSFLHIVKYLYERMKNLVKALQSMVNILFFFLVRDPT